MVCLRCAKTAGNRECLPKPGYESRYQAQIPEKFSWSCVEARVRHILGARVKYGFVQLCEVTVDEYVLAIRKYMYCRRHSQVRTTKATEKETEEMCSKSAI